MNKITINQLNPVDRVNFSQILQDFDIYSIKVDKNFWPNRESLLSINHSEDQKAQKILALDFYNNKEKKEKTVYCVCRKDQIDIGQLRDILDRKDSKAFRPSKMNEDSLKAMPISALLQLFFNQIVDEKVLKGTSLIGKLYLLADFHVGVKKDTLNIAEFSLDNNLVANISAHCFSQLRSLSKKELKKKSHLPRFQISINSKKIRLAATSYRTSEKGTLFIQSPVKRNGKPSASNFLNLQRKNPYKQFVKSRAGMLYRLLDIFNENYGQYFSKLSFKEIDADSKSLVFSQDRVSKDLKATISAFSQEHPIALIDQTGKNQEALIKLKTIMNSLNLKTVPTDQAESKIVLIHDISYYAKKENKNLIDQYRPSINVQHITVEKINNNASDSLQAMVYNAVKELIVKYDLKQFRLSLPATNKITKDFSFFKLFGDPEDGDVYQFRFLTGQDFEIKHLSINDMDNPFLELTADETNNIELLIKDEKEEAYYQIERTDRITLPNMEFNQDLLEYTNHEFLSRIDKNKLIEVINSINGKHKYDQLLELIKKNSSEYLTYKDVSNLLNEARILKGKTKTNLVSQLIEKYGFVVGIESRNAWARNRYLNGLTDLNYWRVRDTVYYNVGLIGNGIARSIARASVIRKITPVSILNKEDSQVSSESVFSLLNTMLVTFVKYTGLTVLPFPEKYINEYQRLENSDESSNAEELS